MPLSCYFDKHVIISTYESTFVALTSCALIHLLLVCSRFYASDGGVHLQFCGAMDALGALQLPGDARLILGDVHHETRAAPPTRDGVLFARSLRRKV